MKPTAKRRSFSSGFSLVELMVAIALGVMVMAGVIASFSGSRAASRSTLGTSSLTDSGRFALVTIGQTLRSSGNLACTSAAQFGPQFLINDAAIPEPLAAAFDEPVIGYEAVGSQPAQTLVLTPTPAQDNNAADWIGGIDPQVTVISSAAPSSLPIAGSDVLAIHGTVPGTRPAYVTTISTGSDSFTVNSAPTSWLNQIAAISDCVTAVVFVVTGDAANVIHHDAGGAAPGNSGSTFQPQLEAGSLVQPVTTTIYYVGVGEDGDGALYSAVWNTATGTFKASEIAPDIESMQVLYGIDTVGQGNVTQYVTADQVTAWNTGGVLSVQIALLAASPSNAVTPPTVAPTFNLLGTTVTAPIDSRRRQIFTNSITLRNSVN